MKVMDLKLNFKIAKNLPKGQTNILQPYHRKPYKQVSRVVIAELSVSVAVSSTASDLSTFKNPMFLWNLFLKYVYFSSKLIGYFSSNTGKDKSYANLKCYDYFL